MCAREARVPSHWGHACLCRRDAKARAIDSFNGNKNTTNFWRERTTTNDMERVSGGGSGGSGNGDGFTGGEKTRRQGEIAGRPWRAMGCLTEEKRETARDRARDVTSRRHSD